MRRSASEVIRNLEQRIAHLEKKSGAPHPDLEKLFNLGRKIQQQKDLAIEHLDELDEMVETYRDEGESADYTLTNVLKLYKHLSEDEWLQIYKVYGLGRGDYRRYERGMKEEVVKELMRVKGFRTASSPIDPRFNPRLASFLTKNSRFFEAEGASIYESEGYVNIHFNDNMPFKALEEIKDLIIRASYTTIYRAKWQVEAWNK